MTHAFNSGAAMLRSRLRKVWAPRNKPSVVRDLTEIPVLETVSTYPSACSGTPVSAISKRQAPSPAAAAVFPNRLRSSDSCSTINSSPAGMATPSISGRGNTPSADSYFCTSGISTGIPSRSKLANVMTPAAQTDAVANSTIIADRYFFIIPPVFYRKLRLSFQQ